MVLSVLGEIELLVKLIPLSLKVQTSKKIEAGCISSFYFIFVTAQN